MRSHELIELLRKAEQAGLTITHDGDRTVITRKGTSVIIWHNGTITRGNLHELELSITPAEAATLLHLS